MCSIRFDIGHDLSEYPTSCDSVIKESLITAVDCGISQSTFSPEVSNRVEDGLFPSRFCFTTFLEDLVMQVSVITNRGVGIVRSAANRHEKCEIVDCLTSTHFENTASELATKPLEWFDGVVGTITMVRAGNGSLKVSVSFPATSYAQPLKSIGIRVKAQGDERAHILYAVSDGNTAIALNRPYTCDYEIPINVSSDTIEDVGDEPVPGLDNYYTKSEVDAALRNYYTAPQVDTMHSEITADFSHYYTKTEVDGGYIANASYNNATNTLTLSSKDGSKQIDLDLS